MRKCKYKTEKERKQAIKENARKWCLANKDHIREYQRRRYMALIGSEARKWEKVVRLPSGGETAQRIAAMETRLSALEAECKDILLDLEEVLKDNKEMRDLIKWGKAK